ncbi:MAG TPA: site-specific integrase [Tepidisphaeraceae bacterium]|nr:site-specific integrase [Tepidisphaeraceae bacterium]
MKLLEQVVVVARRMRLADASIDVYKHWIRRYLSFCAERYGAWRRPEELFTEDVEVFLNHLVMEKRLSASSQNQALNALVLLYKRVLQDAIPQDHLWGRFWVIGQSRRVERARGATQPAG